MSAALQSEPEVIPPNKPDITTRLQEITDLRKRLWEVGGYRPLPVYSHDHPVKDAGKAPLGERWPERARQNPPEAVRLPAVKHAANTGILADGLRPIDIDIEDLTLNRLVWDVARTMLGKAPNRWRLNSPRCLLLYRAAEGEPSKLKITGATHTEENSCQIEVLGRGNQFVAFGTHPSGAELGWNNGGDSELDYIPRDSLPVVTEDQIAAFLTAAALIIGAPVPEQPGAPKQPATHSSNGEFTPAYVKAALEREVAKVRSTPEGGRNDQLNKSAFALGTLVGADALGRDIAEDELRQAALDAGLDPKEIERTIRSGLDSGIAKPREAPEPKLNGHSYRMFAERPQEGGEGQWEERQERPWETRQEAPLDLAPTPLDWNEMKATGPREWVYGHFLIRRFISVLGAPGGTGKTAYAFTIGLAVVTNRELLGETVHETGKLWVYNLEDPKDELMRRFNAACMHHGISQDQVEGKVFIDSGRDRPLVIATKTEKGNVIATPIIEPLIAALKQQQIKLFIVDPFVRTHECEENINDQMNFVAAQWAYVADKADCSVLLLHHFRKGGGSGDADAFRGASALIDASRAAVSLCPMSQEVAKRLGVPDEERWRYVRADNAKLNLAPPPENAVWLKLIGEDLGNATAERPSDKVQTVERWEPPSAYEGVPMALLVRILDRIAAGPEPGEFYAFAAQAKDRWAGNVIVEEISRTEEQAKQILKDWVKNGVLIEDEYKSPKNKSNRLKRVTVDRAKLEEMRRSFRAENDPHE